MAKKSVPEPPLAGRSLPVVFVGAAAFTLVVWGSRFLVDMATQWVNCQPRGRLVPLVAQDVLLGAGWIPIGLYSFWAWRPRRRHAQWHRWIAAVLAPFYFSCLFLLLAASLWNALLGPPWDGFIIVILTVVYVLSWALPAISYPVAKRLETGHHTLDLVLLKWGGPSILVIAGILGASVGLQGGDDRFWIMAFLAPLVAVGWAQYAASYLWPSRPWAKDEEE